MRYSYSASGVPEDLSAILYCDGKEIAKTDGLKDEKALKRWARNTAEQHKWQNAPAPESTYTIAAAGSFTV